MTLHERMMRARQAQVDHEQRHDVQLSMIPFSPRLPLFDSGDPELGREISEMFGEGEPKWATENEVREHFHSEIDHDWREWMSEHYSGGEA